MADQERRKARSHFKDTALQSWLDAVASRAGVSAIVVADVAGLLVASGVAGEQAEEMAVMATRKADPGDKEVTVTDEQGNSLVIRSFSYNDETLFVCARGGLEQGKKGVEEAIAGIARILDKP
jgi:hypothetical protein